MNKKQILQPLYNPASFQNIARQYRPQTTRHRQSSRPKKIKYDIRDPDRSYQKDRYSYDKSPSINKKSEKQNDLEFSPYQHKADELELSFNKNKQNISENREQTANFSPYSQKKQTRKSKDPFVGFHINDKKLNTSDLKRGFAEYEWNGSRELPKYVHEKNSELRNLEIEDLLANNRLLSQQNIEYRQIIGKLENELKIKEAKIHILGQQIEKKVFQQSLLHDHTISEMRTQIKLLLQKNDILNKRIEEYNIFMATSNYKTIEKTDKTENQCKQMIEQLNQFINKEYFNKIIRGKDPGKIKSSNRQLKATIGDIIKRNLKLESFANCLIDMKNKLTRQKQSRDLKKCWKWLKGLVEECSKLKKIKGFEKAARKILNLSSQQPIQHVLQLVLQELKH